MRSYDPATGKQLWELGGMNGQGKASPVAGDELLYVGTGGGPAGFGGGGGGRFGRGGSGRPLFAVKAGAAGDITLKAGDKANDGVAWYQPQAGPSTASPLLYEGRLYILEQRGGLLTCCDAATGKQVYRERLPGRAASRRRRGPTRARCFAWPTTAKRSSCRPGRSSSCWARTRSARCAGRRRPSRAGRVFLRTVEHLYCIKSKQ